MVRSINQGSSGNLRNEILTKGSFISQKGRAINVRERSLPMVRILHVYVRYAGLLHLLYFLYFSPITCFAIAWHSDAFANLDRERLFLFESMICFCGMNVALSAYLFIGLDRHIKSLCILNTIATVLSSLAVVGFFAYCQQIGSLSPKWRMWIPAMVSNWILMAIVANRAWLHCRRRHEKW